MARGKPEAGRARGSGGLPAMPQSGTAAMGSHSPLHPVTADFELLQTTPTANRAKHPAEVLSARLNESALRQEKCETAAKSDSKVTISLKQVNWPRTVSLCYRSRERLSHQSLLESPRQKTKRHGELVSEINDSGDTLGCFGDALT